MSTVVMHNVVSVDGFIADANDDVGPLFDWYFNGDPPLIPGEMDDPSPGGMKISKVSYDYVRPTWASRNATEPAWPGGYVTRSSTDHREKEASPSAGTIDVPRRPR